jgi:hypothetical protein
MSIGGWVTMILSLTVVWAGAIWCYIKVLSTPQEEKVPVGFGP